MKMWAELGPILQNIDLRRRGHCEGSAGDVVITTMSEVQQAESVADPEGGALCGSSKKG